jgi:hypothetical protein
MFAERVFCYFTGKRESAQPNKKTSARGFQFRCVHPTGNRKGEKIEK